MKKILIFCGIITLFILTSCDSPTDEYILGDYNNTNDQVNNDSCEQNNDKSANTTGETNESCYKSDTIESSSTDENEATNSKSVEITEDIVNNTFSIIGKMENLSPEEKVEKMKNLFF